MKKLLSLLLPAIILISCATPKIISLQEAEYKTEFNYHDVIILSKATDFFKVYKINDSEYAFLPSKNTDHVFNIDDLSACIILSESEAKEFKDNLEKFVQACENKKNNIFLAEVKVQQSVTKTTTDIQTQDGSTETISSSSQVSPAFIIQGAIRKSSGTKQLEISAARNDSIFSLTLNDVKNLIKALEK